MIKNPIVSWDPIVAYYAADAAHWIKLNQALNNLHKNFSQRKQSIIRVVLASES